MQHQIQQRAVDLDAGLDAAVIFYQPQISEFVHEETDAGSGCADHLRQCLLADFRDDRLGLSLLAKVGQQQKKAGKAFLAGIEQLIDKISFDTDGPTQKMRNEHLGEGRFVVNHAHHGRLVEMHDYAVAHGGGARYALRLAGKTCLAEEFVRIKNGDDGLFALLGNDSDLDLALLNVEDRICGVALSEYGLILAVFGNAAALADFGEKGLWIECRPPLDRHDAFRLSLPTCELIIIIRLLAVKVAGQPDDISVR